MPEKQMEMNKDFDDEPATETERQLTIGVVALVLNMRGMLKTYEDLAAKSDVVPDPNMYDAIEQAIYTAHCGIAMKEGLVRLAEKFGNHLLECTGHAETQDPAQTEIATPTQE